MNVVALRRQVFYILMMVGLLVPLFLIGKPGVRGNGEYVGTLAMIRDEYDLGQADLGDIDPASESMRLATLGLRGVAATILWQQAEYYKKEQFWDRLSATLNQIAILQPHFVKVWEFQSHNLSYNISVEFDDYRQRYQWVKRGIDYLIKGAKFNKKRTEMPYELGWFFGNKMGVADEKKQYRELYRNDNIFHSELTEKILDVNDSEGVGPDKKPDNWLSGRLFYELAYAMVIAGEKPAKSPLMFYRMSSSWLTKYAEGLQAEGQLGDAARVAWRRAAAGLKEFGDKRIQTTFGDEISLNIITQANQDLERAQKEFAEFAGEDYIKAMESRRKQLTPEQLVAVEKDNADRSFEELVAAEQADALLRVNLKEIATSLPADKQVKALQLAEKVSNAETYIQHIEIYRNQINYGYWKERCEAEQEDAALIARTNMYDANLLLDKGELDGALEKYQVAWNAWNDLFNKFPAMMIDDAADDVMKAIDRYAKLLETGTLPKDFILNDFLEFRRINETSMADPAMMSLVSEWPARYPGRSFLKEMLKKSKTNNITIPPSQPVQPAEEQPVAPEKSAAEPEAAVKETAPEGSPIKAVAPDEGAPPAPVAPQASEALSEVPDEPAAAQPDEGEAPAPPK